MEDHIYGANAEPAVCAAAPPSTAAPVAAAPAVLVPVPAAPVAAAPAVLAPVPAAPEVLASVPAAPAVLAPVPVPAAPTVPAPVPVPAAPTVLAPVPVPAAPVAAAAPTVLAPVPVPAAPAVLAPLPAATAPALTTPAPARAGGGATAAAWGDSAPAPDSSGTKPPGQRRSADQVRPPLRGTSLNFYSESEYLIRGSLCCPVCRLKVATRRQLELHVDAHEVTLNVDGSKHVGRQFVARREELQPLVCDICDLTLSSPWNLKVHLRKMHGEGSRKSKPFFCEICQKTLLPKTSVKRHMLTHGDEKPYSCTLCSKTFKSTFSLKGHLLVHSGARPFKCDMCDKAFRTKSTLTVHKRCHTKETPYSCPSCPLKFRDAGARRRHSFTHSAVKPFPCRFCPRSYTTAQSRTTHEAAHAAGRVKGAKRLRADTQSSGASPEPAAKRGRTEVQGSSETPALEVRGEELEQLLLPTQAKENTLSALVNSSQPLQVVETVVSATGESQSNGNAGNTEDGSEVFSFLSEDVLVDHTVEVLSVTNGTLLPAVTNLPSVSNGTLLPAVTNLPSVTNGSLLSAVTNLPSVSNGTLLPAVTNLPSVTNGSLLSAVTNLPSPSFPASASLSAAETSAAVASIDVVIPQLSSVAGASESRTVLVVCGNTEMEQQQQQQQQQEGSLQCRLCRMTLPSAPQLSSHLPLHLGAGASMCDKCGQAVYSEDLPRHACPAGLSKPHTCHVCCKMFSDPAKYEQHVASCSRDKPFPCDQCRRKFASSSALESHKLTHSPDRPYPCSDCGKRFARLHDLKIHLPVHSGEKQFACPHCEKRCRTKSQLTSHLKCHTNERSYRCPHCEKTFARSNEFNVHLRGHTGERPYSCQQCGRRFTTGFALRQHSLTHSPECSFKCPQCQMEFRTARSLKCHALTHGQARSFRCPQCPKQFTSKSGLMAHSAAHLPESEKPFQCRECGRGFMREQLLQKHEAAHRAWNTRYACPVCQKEFGTEVGCKNHLKIHADGEFSCTVCDSVFHTRNQLHQHEAAEHKSSLKCSVCERVFKSARWLKSHVCGPPQKTPYACPHCPNTYAFAKFLEKHMQKHQQQEGMFPCPACEKSFPTEFSLDKHLESHSAEQLKEVYTCSCSQCGRKFRGVAGLDRHVKVCTGEPEGGDPGEKQSSGGTQPQTSGAENHSLTQIQGPARKDDELASQSQPLARKDDESATQSQGLARKGDESAIQCQSLARVDDESATQSQGLAEKDDESATQSQGLARVDDESATQIQGLARKDYESNALSQGLARKDYESATQSQGLARKEDESAAQSQGLARKEDESAIQSQGLARKDDEPSTGDCVPAPPTEEPEKEKDAGRGGESETRSVDAQTVSGAQKLAGEDASTVAVQSLEDTDASVGNDKSTEASAGSLAGQSENAASPEKETREQDKETPTPCEESRDGCSAENETSVPLGEEDGPAGPACVEEHVQDPGEAPEELSGGRGEDSSAPGQDGPTVSGPQPVGGQEPEAARDAPVQYQCRSCQDMFPSAEAILNHVPSCRCYQCECCRQVFKTAEDIVRHMQTCTSPLLQEADSAVTSPALQAATFQCPECEERFSSRPACLEHMQLHALGAGQAGGAAATCMSPPVQVVLRKHVQNIKVVSPEKGGEVSTLSPVGANVTISTSGEDLGSPSAECSSSSMSSTQLDLILQLEKFINNSSNLGESENPLSGNSQENVSLVSLVNSPASSPRKVMDGSRRLPSPAKRQPSRLTGELPQVSPLSSSPGLEMRPLTSTPATPPSRQNSVQLVLNGISTPAKSSAGPGAADLSDGLPRIQVRPRLRRMQRARVPVASVPPAPRVQPQKPSPQSSLTFVCTDCGSTFPTLSLMVSHRSQAHPPRPPPVFPCLICQKEFASEAELNDAETHHCALVQQKSGLPVNLASGRTGRPEGRRSRGRRQRQSELRPIPVQASSAAAAQIPAPAPAPAPAPSLPQPGQSSQ